MTATGWTITALAAGATLVAADIILHRLAQGGLLRAQDEPIFYAHDEEQAQHWDALEAAYASNGWEQQAELGRCAVHGVRRCTICLGEQNR